MMDINEPKDKKFSEAVSLVKTLQEAGFIAYLAGGCVRDLILNYVPKDYDISTSAKPDEIEKTFPKTIPVGKQFGVIKVVGKYGNYDVATFREESDYEDKRRPTHVIWTTAKGDAARRDFTANALFYNPVKKEILDFTDGLEDIKKKIICFVGKPSERIQEDNLRIIRAVRFKNKLNFEYDKKTKDALKKYVGLIVNVSPERVKQELDAILINKNRAGAFCDLSELGILKYILPEVEKMKSIKQPAQFHAEGDCFVHTILSLEKLPSKTIKEVAWATLLHDIGKPDTSAIREHKKYGKRLTFYGHVDLSAKMSDKIARRLKFSNEERKKVVFLVAEHLRHKDILKMKLARQRRWLAHPDFDELMAVWKADGEASYLGKKGKIDLFLYNETKKLYQEEQKRPKLPRPLLNGNEIMKLLKINPGPMVGKILKDLEEAQLEEKFTNKKQAIEFLKEKC